LRPPARRDVQHPQHTDRAGRVGARRHALGLIGAEVEDAYVQRVTDRGKAAYLSVMESHHVLHVSVLSSSRGEDDLLTIQVPPAGPLIVPPRAGQADVVGRVGKHPEDLHASIPGLRVTAGEDDALAGRIPSGVSTVDGVSPLSR